MSTDRPFLVRFGKAAQGPTPRAVRRTARKEFACESGCGDPIMPGDVYRYTSNMRSCVACFDKRFPEATS